MKASLTEHQFWYVARTNIQCEDKAMMNLHRAGFEAYLPRYRQEIKHHRTKCITIKERMLMPRYLFVAIPRQDFGFVRACEGVESLLGVQGKPLPVPFRVIEGIFLAEIDMAFDQTRQAEIHRGEREQSERKELEKRFKTGRKFRVAGGIFTDFDATVEGLTEAGQVRVLVDIFKRMTPVTLDPSALAA